MRFVQPLDLKIFSPRLIVRSVGIPLLALFALPALLEASDDDPFAQIIAPAFQQHCAKCHGSEEESEADLNLLALDRGDLLERAELIRSLIDALDLKEMPPEDEPPLEPGLRETLIGELTSILHTSIAKQQRYSQTPIRRMNRFQYNNAVTDLFELKCVVFTLPERMMRGHNGYFKPKSGKMADVVAVGSRPLGKSQMIEPRLAGVTAFPQDLRAEHGFDNQGDHLSLSPLLMEAFLQLGQSITQSPDFHAENVGIWKDFFAAPTVEKELHVEVRRRLDRFLYKAFRRPISEGIRERYVGFAIAQIESGVSFPDAMKAVASAVLASPRFLYLYETSSQADATEEVDHFELASRLSFFLWGSLPDQVLLDAASNGRLKEQEVLLGQVERMLKDPKLKRFCDSFPTQWLQLERIISSVPNRDKYPEFYYLKYRDSMHMMIEPLLVFETVLIENQPITQLIDSDFTYRSKLLAEAYQPGAKKKAGGGGEVTALRFRRIPVTDRRNGGVITNAAVMTMTSGPERTQPITRGAWIAAVIFNNPPDPPPADVPALDETPSAAEQNLTLRERLAMHRQRSDCKGCHEQIDPLGFALENYDPIGVWRDKYENGRDVDMAGKLFQKHAFSDVIEFKDAMLAEKDRFTRALGGHLLSFALARELDAVDHFALDQIVVDCAADDYKIQTLLKQVVLSKPFRHKYNPADPAVQSTGTQP